MKETTIIVATGNAHKMQEIRQILAGVPVKLLSMKEAGLSLEIEENGTTFEENARIKAMAVMRASGQIAMADDSGLEVDALNKEPGIYSSRYMGEDTPYEIKNQSLIDRLEGVPDEKRTARFVCAVVCAFPDGRCVSCKETMEGRIAYRISGENGFGYDPVFFLPELGCTSAELSPDEKNRISHRGKAMRRMRDLLEDQL